MKKVQLIVFLLLAITLKVKAGDLESELKKINVVYGEMVYELDISIDVYTSQASLTPYETTRGKFAKQGKNYRSELSDIVMIQNESVSLVLNTELGYMTVGDVSESVVNPMGLVQMDQMRMMCDTFYLQQLSSRTSKIVFKLKDQSFFDGVEEVSVIYDTQTHFIKKVVMLYGEERHLDDDPTKELVKPKMEIRYSNLQVSEDLGASKFSTAAYIKMEKDLVRLQPAYQSYTLSDQRKTRVK